MDFGKLDPAGKVDGNTMVIKHPVNGKPLLDEATKEPAIITVISRDSAEARKFIHEMASQKVNNQLGGKLRVDGEELEARGLEAVVVLVKGWKHIEMDGKPLEYSEANCRMLLGRLIWLREQIEAFASDRSNYLGN
jgi:hypothetical protein